MSVFGSVMPGSHDLGAAGVHHDLRAVIAPPLAQLGLAVHDRDDLHALAAGVGQPERQRDGADLGHLVQGQQQRRVQAAAGGAWPISVAV